MQHDWFGPALSLALVFMFLLFGVLALRKMRARRRLEYAEPEARRAPLSTPAAREALEEADAELEATARERVAPEVEAVAPATERVPELAPEPLPEPTDARLKAGLAKTHASLFGRINALLGRGPTVDAGVLDELEEVLLTADVGVGLATRFIDDLRKRLKARELDSASAVREALRDRLLSALASQDHHAHHGDMWNGTGPRPRVVLFVGVNGVGKTTTIGKIASQLRDDGKTVLLAAGDTFRAAAAEQLTIWGERSGAEVIRGAEGADPASVIFKAIQAGCAAGVDVVLADTAGRLHTKTELMDEIGKVKRAASKARDGAPDETWLVVDATTGQNALQQAREFHQTLGLTGVILTKLDGTAKGGVVVAIVDALKIPVRYVGVGEQAGDLRPFNPKGFVSALFEGA